MLHEYTLKQLLIEEDLNESITDLIAKPTQWVMRQIQKVFPQNKTAKQEALNDEDLKKLMEKWPVWGIVYDIFERYNTSWLRTFDKTYKINVSKQFKDKDIKDENGKKLAVPVLSQAVLDSDPQKAMEELVRHLNHPIYGAALRAPAPDHNPDDAPPPVDREQLMAAFTVIGACMMLNSDEPEKACVEALSNLGGQAGGIGDYIANAGVLLGIPVLTPLLPAGLAVLGSVLAYAAVVGVVAARKGAQIDEKQVDILLPIMISFVDGLDRADGKLTGDEKSILPMYRASEAAQKLVDAWVDFESKVIPSLLNEPYQMPDIATTARRALASEFDLTVYLKLIEDDEEMKDKFEELFLKIDDPNNKDYQALRITDTFAQLKNRREQRTKEKNEKFIKDFNDKYGELQDITDEELSAALGEALNRAIRIIQMEDRE